MPANRKIGLTAQVALCGCEMSHSCNMQAHAEIKANKGLGDYDRPKQALVCNKIKGWKTRGQVDDVCAENMGRLGIKTDVQLPQTDMLSTNTYAYKRTPP